MPNLSSFVISIDRTSMSLPPLVLSGSRDVAGSGVLGVTGWREPAMRPRVRYAPSSRAHGDLPLGWAWQQTVLVFRVSATDQAASEDVHRSAVQELTDAVSRLEYQTTVTVDGAPAEVWACDPGSVEPDTDRSYSDIKLHNPTWIVSVPAYPIREVAS